MAIVYTGRPESSKCPETGCGHAWSYDIEEREVTNLVRYPRYIDGIKCGTVLEPELVKQYRYVATCDDCGKFEVIEGWAL